MLEIYKPTTNISIVFNRVLLFLFELTHRLTKEGRTVRKSRVLLDKTVGGDRSTKEGYIEGVPIASDTG